MTSISINRGLKAEPGAEALNDKEILCSPDEVLLILHSLGNLGAPLSEASRDSLASALKKKFSSVSLEVASPASGVSYVPLPSYYSTAGRDKSMHALGRMFYVCILRRQLTSRPHFT